MTASFLSETALSGGMGRGAWLLSMSERRAATGRKSFIRECSSTSDSKSSEKPSMFERMEGIEMDFREELGTAFKSDDRDEADVEDVDEDEAEEEDDDDVC